MKDKDKIILADLIDLHNSKAVFTEVKKIFCYHYPKTFFKEIEKCYKQVKSLFEGKFSDYNACNTKYHDLMHTLDIFLAAARLMDGYNLKETKLSERLAINLLKASLLHDTGYIQEKWDNEGTGAKHTMNHIGRSIAFVMKNRGDLAISKEDVDDIAKMIRCTEIKNRISTIPFSSEEEKTAGIIVGSADILGQMSDREYLERLLFLYNEMKEAGVPGYSTEFDIIKSTLKLYKSVKGRLNNSFNKVYSYVENHFSERFNINKNLYIDAIEKNIAYIEKIINDSTTNFRQKLKRGNFVDTRTHTDETRKDVQ
ncbi:MAG: HD domain-containing protein [Spirochaetota bacterium]